MKRRLKNLGETDPCIVPIKSVVSFLIPEREYVVAMFANIVDSTGR